jgi:PAS domain S-box-containing protein
VVEKSEVTGGETSQPRSVESAPDPDEVIRVAVVEDGRPVQEALLSILDRSPEFEVVAVVPEGHDLRLEAGPHLVLLALGPRYRDSARAARRVLGDFPDARVVVMDLPPAHEELLGFVSAGVSGFIMKDAPLALVLDTLRSVQSGRNVLPDEITARLFSEIAWEVATSGVITDHAGMQLTPREREVSDLVAEGLSNRAIGERIHVSVHTVRSHLRNIMDKLGAHSRLQIAARVHQREVEAAELRSRAEDRVNEDARAIPSELDGLSMDQVRGMLHELQVHQIELEMQNEALRQAQAELEASHERYFDLFDLAPVGYFTLAEDARILKANLTGGELLGVPRSDLVDRPFTRFIVPDDQDSYYHHRRAVIRAGSPGTCQLRMVRSDGSTFPALLESAPSRPVDEQATLRTVVSDMSIRQQEPGR